MNRVRRFLKYTAIGISTFGVDLLLLFLFADIFSFNYLFAAGCAYVVAISINYLLSRKYVFDGTLRSAHAGYAIFLSIAIIGLLIVTGCMYVLVSAYGLNLFASRILVAGIVGVWNYVMNLYVNFQVHDLRN